MAPAHSPTVRARRLGTYLRKLREQHDLSFAAVAARLDVHHTTIRRIEHGLHKTDIAVIEQLLDVYGVETPRRLQLLDLAENAFRRGWWQEYPDVIDDTFACLEDEASLIRSWQVQVVPGLLQTKDYARALFSAGASPADPSEIEQRVEARAERRKLLDRDNAPRLHAVLSETALHQSVGGDDIMRRQLEDLAEMAKRDNVTIQIVPFAAGAHAGLGGPFIVLEFAHEDDPDVAYTEQISGHVFSESEGVVERFRLAWGNIADVALSPDDSAAMIAALANHHTTGDQTA